MSASSWGPDRSLASTRRVAGDKAGRALVGDAWGIGTTNLASGQGFQGAAQWFPNSVVTAITMTMAARNGSSLVIRQNLAGR
jgi:hypothetical protein